MSEAEYFSNHGADIGFADPLGVRRQSYEFNIRSAQAGLQASSFLTALVEHLDEISKVYAGGRPELLFFPYSPSDIQIRAKPYSSLLTKIFRHNYLLNKKFPEEPKGGYIQQDNMYEHSRVNDLLRSRLICKYLDGPRFVAEGLSDFCDRAGYKFKSYPMNNDAGYYAWHCYIKVPVDIMEADSVSTKETWFELQFTTQLAEVITSLTHGLYEGDRVSPQTAIGQDWKWEPKTQRFRSAYLGHSLHLLEGIIQSFRDEVLQIEDSVESEAQAHQAEQAPEAQQ